MEGTKKISPVKWDVKIYIHVQADHPCKLRVKVVSQLYFLWDWDCNEKEYVTKQNQANDMFLTIPFPRK